MKKLGDEVLSAQIPVLSWWALATVITRTATTLTILAILMLGVWFYLHGETTVGEIVMFMSYATLLIGKLDRRSVSPTPWSPMRRGCASSSTCSTPCRPCATGRTRSIPAGCAAGRIQGRDLLLRRQAPGGAGPEFHGAARRDHGPGRRDRRRQVDGAGAAASRLRSAVRRDQDRRHRHPRHDPDRAAAQHRRGVPGSLLFDRSVAENLRVGKPDATEEEMRAACERAQVLDVIERNPEGFDDAGRRARPHVLRRRAPAPVDRARAAEGPADPDSRRGDQRARRGDRGQDPGGARTR